MARPPGPRAPDPRRLSAAGAAEPGLLRLIGLPHYVIAFAARLPFSMMVIGVLTLVVSVRGSLAAGGVAAAAVGVGVAALGPPIGALADRLGQRPVLVALVLANAAALLGFTAAVYGDAGDAAILLLAFAIGATVPQAGPMTRSRMMVLVHRRVVPERRERTISSGMAYESMADEVAFVVGPLLVGLLAATIAPWAPLVVGAALTIVVGGAFALHPLGRGLSSSRGARAPSPARALLHPRLLLVVAGAVGMGLFFGATLTALTSFMADRDAADATGLLYGIAGSLSAVCALAVAALPASFAPRWRWPASAALLAAGAVALAAADGIPTMAAALAVAGIGIGPTLVALYSAAADRSPAGRSATVMATVGSAVILGQSAGAVIAGRLAEGSGTAAAFAIPLAAAGVVLVAGVADALLTRVPVPGP